MLSLVKFASLSRALLFGFANAHSLCTCIALHHVIVLVKGALFCWSVVGLNDGKGELLDIATARLEVHQLNVVDAFQLRSLVFATTPACFLLRG